MMEFIGRLHPLIVHLPIGILLLAGAFDVLACFKPYRKLRNSVGVMILFGAVASTVSVISGWTLADNGAYDDRLVQIHKTTGIVTTLFAWIVFFGRDSFAGMFKQKKKQRVIRVFMFIPLAGLIAVTGHFGGSLTHGEDYLFGVSEKDAQSLKLSWKGDADTARIYTDIIAPILDTRCYSCHGPTKQKGQLRLDERRFIDAGGKHGPVIDLVHPDSSELYRRLMLPREDEHHMPPNEKAQLASAELALIRAWLVEGAPFDKRISELKSSTSVKGYLQVILAPSRQMTILPSKEVAQANEASIAALTAKRIVVMPLSDSTHYLSVSYVNAPQTTDEEISSLLPLKDQLLSLDLGRTAIGDGALQHLSALVSLRQLNLQYTGISDAALRRIQALNQLQKLNLIGTRITDAGLQELHKLPALKKVWCYQTQVTKSGVENLRKLRADIVIDTGGYVLPARVTDTLEYKAGKR